MSSTAKRFRRNAPLEQLEDISCKEIADSLPMPCIGSLASAAPLVAPRIRLITIQDVCDILGLGKSAVHAMVARHELPPPIKFGTSRRAAARWIEQEIVNFVCEKAAQRPSPLTKAKDQLTSHTPADDNNTPSTTSLVSAERLKR